MTKELFDWTERFIAGPHTTKGEAEKLRQLLGIAKDALPPPPASLTNSCCLSVSRDRRDEISVVRLDFEEAAEADAAFEWLDAVVQGVSE